jgi:hypothetical protein
MSPGSFPLRILQINFSKALGAFSMTLIAVIHHVRHQPQYPFEVSCVILACFNWLFEVHARKKKEEFRSASNMAIGRPSGELWIRRCGGLLWANILDKWQYATGSDTTDADNQLQTMAMGELG